MPTQTEIEAEIRRDHPDFAWEFEPCPKYHAVLITSALGKHALRGLVDVDLFESAPHEADRLVQIIRRQASCIPEDECATAMRKGLRMGCEIPGLGGDPHA